MISLQVGFVHSIVPACLGPIQFFFFFFTVLTLIKTALSKIQTSQLPRFYQFLLDHTILNSSFLIGGTFYSFSKPVVRHARVRVHPFPSDNIFCFLSKLLVSYSFYLHAKLFEIALYDSQTGTPPFLSSIHLLLSYS